MIPSRPASTRSGRPTSPTPGSFAGCREPFAIAGFAAGRLRSHGYVQIEDPDYMLSIADRGADALGASSTIGAELAAALKAEARRRVAAHMYGHVAYASLTARKPA